MIKGNKRISRERFPFPEKLLTYCLSLKYSNKINSFIDSYLTDVQSRIRTDLSVAETRDTVAETQRQIRLSNSIVDFTI